MKKNKFSNWREDLREVVDIPPNDSGNKREVTEKKVKNKVVINPTMKETFDKLGGTILEVEEIEEGLFGKPKPLGKTKATYGGEPEKKDKRMSVSAADIKAKTPAAQRLAAGDPRYKKIGEETVDPETKKQLDTKKKMMKKQQMLQMQQLRMQQQGKLPMGHATMEETEQVDEKFATQYGDKTKLSQSSKRKSLGRGSSIKDGAKKTGYESPAEFRSTEKKFSEETVNEKMDLAKADMGDVIKDFRKSDAPQFKGKTKEKKRQMAIAAKLEAERGPQNEETGDKHKEAIRIALAKTMPGQKPLNKKDITARRQETKKKEKESGVKPKIKPFPMSSRFD